MKKILAAITIALLMIPAGGRAQSEKDSLKCAIDDAETESLTAMSEDDYQKALDARVKQLKLIEENFGKADSAYCLGLVQKGKCLARLDRFAEAANTIAEATSIYGANFSRTDYEYAVMLDNWSVYLALNKEYEKSLEKADSSLMIFNTLPDYKPSMDMAAVLIHVAESYYYLKIYDKAIVYQIRGLDQLRRIYSEHSDIYINELKYLAEYQELNGEKGKAEKTTEKTERLKKDVDNGVVEFPDLSEVKDADDAHERRFDAARMANFLLTHYVTHEKMNDVARFLYSWMEQSNDCDVLVGEDEAKLLTVENGGIYFVAFEAAACKRAIKNNDKDFTLSRYLLATMDMMKYYDANKNYTGKMSYIEKLWKMCDKNPDKFYKYLNDKYEKMTAFAKANKESMQKAK